MKKKSDSRRTFLKQSLLGMASVASYNLSSLASSEAQSNQPLKVTVVIQLLGGVDTLLMLPLTSGYEDLAEIRGDYTRINPQALDEIVPGIAYHPSLAGLMPFLPTTRISLMTGVAMTVGASRSHNVAQNRMAIGGTESEYGRVGWTGRLYDEGVNLVGLTGKGISLSCTKCEQPPIRMTTYEDFNAGSASLPTDVGGANNAAFVNEILKEMLDVKPQREVSDIEKKFRVNQKTMFDAVDVISETLSYKSNGYELYPTYRLGLQLRNIAQSLTEMQSKGVGGRHVFVVGVGGYDIHADWMNRGERLMSHLGGALQVFLTDLLSMGLYDNVVTMLTSEFGRTVRAGKNKESKRAGSDHGIGFPSLVFGGNVKGSFYGDVPTVADLKRMPGNAWRREVAQERLIIEILEKHMNIDAKKIFSDYNKIPNPGDIDLIRA